MGNLVGKFKPKTVIICRNYNKEIIGIYESPVSKKILSNLHIVLTNDIF